MVEQHDKAQDQIDHNVSDEGTAGAPPANMIQPDPTPAESPEVTNNSRHEHSGNTDDESLQSLQIVNLSSVASTSPSPAKRLEELFRSLNSTEAPAPNSNITRKDTGWAIAKANNYHSEGSMSNNINLHDSQAIVEQQDQAISDGRRQNTGTDTASASVTTNATPESMQETQSSSIPQQSSRKTSSGAVYACIHYHRILTCVFLFRFTVQLLFALALGGVLGYATYFVASWFLVVLMAAAMFVVVDGTRQRLKEIKEIREANLESAT